MRKFPASFNIGLANCRKKVEDAKPYDCGLRIADSEEQKAVGSQSEALCLDCLLPCAFSLFPVRIPQLAERKEIKVENALD
jgi:hypothetical protein